MLILKIPAVDAADRAGAEPRAHSNCVRFLPPLVISDEQIDEGMAVIAASLEAVSKRAGAV